MDPIEGRRYIEHVKDEVFRGWDHVYNISEDYIYPTANRGLGWCNTISTSSDFDDTMENWQNRMHEACLRKCVLITQLLCHVSIEIIDFPIYEGLLEISGFLE